MLSKLYLKIFIIALTLRVGYISFFPQELPKYDAAGYDSIAWNISKGRGFSLNNQPTAFRMPLYPLLLAGIYKIFGHNYYFARLFQAILSAFNCLIIFIIANKIFNRKIALYSSLLLTCYPVLIVYTGLFLTETVFTFLLSVSMMFLIFWVKEKEIKYILLSGLFLGLATLVRPTTVLLPIFLAFCVYFVVKNRFGAIKILLILVGLMCIVLLPWVIRNKIVFNRFIPLTTYHGSLFMYILFSGGPTPETGLEVTEITRGLSEIEFDEVLKEKTKTMIKNNPFGVILNIIKATRFLPRFWITSHSSVFGIDRSNLEYLERKQYSLLFIKFLLLCIHLFFLITAGIGILLSKKFIRYTIFFIVLFLYFSLHLTNVPRYHLPVMPYIFIFSAVSIEVLMRKIILKKYDE